MSHSPEEAASGAVEALHMGALAIAALSLLGGLLLREPVWVNTGVSLILLLPPLRLATTIIGETRAGRYAVAMMGTVVLAFLLFSRRIS